MATGKINYMVEDKANPDNVIVLQTIDGCYGNHSVMVSTFKDGVCTNGFQIHRDFAAVLCDMEKKKELNLFDAVKLDSCADIINDDKEITNVSAEEPPQEPSPK